MRLKEGLVGLRLLKLVPPKNRVVFLICQTACLSLFSLSSLPDASVVELNVLDG